MPILNQISNLISGLPFFVWSEIIAISISFYTIALLSKKNSKERNFLYNTKHLLIIIIAASVLEDFAWLFNTLKLTILPQLDLRLIILIIRIAWLFAVIQYQSFNLFIESLIPNPSKFLILINRFTSLISAIYGLFLISLIAFKSHILDKRTLELLTMNSITNIYMPALILIYILFTLIIFKEDAINQDLRKTLYNFTLGFVGPTILIDTIHLFIHNYTIIALSALFIAITAFLCTRQILKTPLANDEL